jgi:uncharacterized protein YecE (DUF72 family)
VVGLILAATLPLLAAVRGGAPARLEAKLFLVRVRVGTSGYSYKAWKGSFYPADLPDARMLPYYASRLGVVEINNTFYRMPTRDLVLRWAEAVPADFCFVLKAPQRITHQKRLSALAAPDLEFFLDKASLLGSRLGCVLFQLPPFFKKDVARLADFLALVPASVRAAFEFRHASWFEEDVYEALRGRSAALCSADTDESGDEGAPIVATAPWGYLRLRRSEYGDADLAAWAGRVGRQPWSEAFVFFKHEDEGKAPALAERFKAHLS